MNSSIVDKATKHLLEERMGHISGHPVSYLVLKGIHQEQMVLGVHYKN